MNPEAAALLERMCSAEVAAIACTYREQHPLRGERLVAVLHVAPDRWAVADATGPVWWSDGARGLVRSHRGDELERSHGAVAIFTSLQACLRPARFGVCWQLAQRREAQSRVEADLRRGGWWWSGPDPPRTAEEYRRRALEGPTPGADRAPEPVVHDGRAAHRLLVADDRGTVRLVVDDTVAIVLSLAGDRFAAELTDVDLDPSIPDFVFELGDAW